MRVGARLPVLHFEVCDAIFYYVVCCALVKLMDCSKETGHCFLCLGAFRSLWCKWATANFWI